MFTRDAALKLRYSPTGYGGPIIGHYSVLDGSQPKCFEFTAAVVTILGFTHASGVPKLLLLLLILLIPPPPLLLQYTATYCVLS